MRGVDARVHIYTAVALERSRMGSPMLDCLYTGERPRYSFYRRLSGPQDWSGHEGVKKKSPPLPTLGLNPGCPALSQAPCRFSLSPLPFVIIHHNHQRVLPKGRSFAENTGTSIEILSKDRSLQTQEPALQFCPKAGLPL